MSSGWNEAESKAADSGEFERQVRTLLIDSADRLPGSVRSRLTQARYAAIAARPSRRLLDFGRGRHWLSAGAFGAAALALLIVFVPAGRPALESPVANPGLEDVEMLSDSDAVPLNGDKDVDYDFYEWAAEEAEGAAGPAVGT